MPPRALLVNPWIHDFAAHDFWARPLGLLEIGAALRGSGYLVDFIDCLDIHYPGRSAPLPKRRANGSGRFDSAAIEKPAPLSEVPRYYKRYGMPPEAFRNILGSFERPDLVLMSSVMTYWYRGVAETAGEIKRVFPDAPVILGGVYATLMPGHAAENTGAEFVAAGPWPESLPPIFKRLGLPFDDVKGPLFPAWGLYHRPPAGAVMTGRGCPFKCPYCASSIINPGFTRRDPEEVADEVARLAREHGVRDVALLDDAIRAEGDDRFSSFLKAHVRLGSPARLHAINALHARGFTLDLARLMRAARLETVRLGIETTDTERASALGGKACLDDLAQAAAVLGRAGYPASEIGAYLLVGLPGQRPGEVESSIDEVIGAGARPYLSESSPVPGTAMWEDALAHSRFDLAEPLFHNNTLLPCAVPGFGEARWSRLKRKAREPYRPARRG